MFHDVCLNIDTCAPAEVFEKIGGVYRSTEYWCGNGEDGCPAWKGEGIGLTASAEPGGIQISGEMPEDKWEEWYGQLTKKLTEALGYEIGDVCDGYPIKHWKPFIKRYADIKYIDGKHIEFSDYSQFFWYNLEKHERDITAVPPYFAFRSEYTELIIVFDSSKLSSKNKEDFNAFYAKLNELGIRTLDLT